MRKIMFNDNFGLTKAVIEGRKTQTRRVCTENQLKSILHLTRRDDFNIEELVEGCTKDEAAMYGLNLFAPYAKNKVIAIAQTYKNAGLPETITEFGLTTHLFLEAGWTNKMFVQADLMPHRIKITNVNIERLQDISDEDCLREGIRSNRFKDGCKLYSFEDLEGINFYKTPVYAYSVLVDKAFGKGTWSKNPYVFVYNFKLIQ